MDPAAPIPQTSDQRKDQKIAALERQIAELRAGGRPAVGNGAPTVDPTKVPEGAEYIDRTNRRKYYVVGDGTTTASHVWRYATLT